MGGGGVGGFDDFDDERPLLEELGIDFQDIWRKTQAVLNPFSKKEHSIMEHADLAGPFCYAMLLGMLLLLSQKMQFGYIYGVGTIGCLGLSMVINLMCEKGVELYTTTSVLGYCLLPMAALAAVSPFVGGVPAMAVAIACVSWATLSASSIFVATLNMAEQRWLLVYPIALFYIVFALLCIF